MSRTGPWQWKNKIEVGGAAVTPRTRPPRRATFHYQGLESSNVTQDLPGLLERLAFQQPRGQIGQAVSRRRGARLPQTGPYQSHLGRVVRETALHVPAKPRGHRRRAAPHPLLLVLFWVP